MDPQPTRCTYSPKGTSFVPRTEIKSVENYWLDRNQWRVEVSKDAVRIYKSDVPDARDDPTIDDYSVLMHTIKDFKGYWEDNGSVLLDRGKNRYTLISGNGTTSEGGAQIFDFSTGDDPIVDFQSPFLGGNPMPSPVYFSKQRIYFDMWGGIHGVNPHQFLTCDNAEEMAYSFSFDDLNIETTIKREEPTLTYE